MVAIGQADSSFDRDKLVAWCIVPFDAKRRGPAARVEMLKPVSYTHLTLPTTPYV